MTARADRARPNRKGRGRSAHSATTRGSTHFNVAPPRPVGVLTLPAETDAPSPVSGLRLGDNVETFAVPKLLTTLRYTLYEFFAIPDELTRSLPSLPALAGDRRLQRAIDTFRKALGAFAMPQLAIFDAPIVVRTASRTAGDDVPPVWRPYP